MWLKVCYGCSTNALFCTNVFYRTTVAEIHTHTKKTSIWPFNVKLDAAVRELSFDMNLQSCVTFRVSKPSELFIKTAA